MNAMNAAEPGSTGAALMSRVHQLSAGKRGNGPGRGPLATGWPVAAPAQRKASTSSFGQIRPERILESLPSRGEMAEDTCGRYAGTRLFEDQKNAPRGARMQVDRKVP